MDKDFIAPAAGAQGDVDLVAHADLSSLGFKATERERRQLVRSLQPSERVVRILPGEDGRRQGLLALTTSRALSVTGRTAYGWRIAEMVRVREFGYDDLAAFLADEDRLHHLTVRLIAYGVGRHANFLVFDPGGGQRPSREEVLGTFAEVAPAVARRMERLAPLRDALKERKAMPGETAGVFSALAPDEQFVRLQRAAGGMAIVTDRRVFRVAVWLKHHRPDTILELLPGEEIVRWERSASPYVVLTDKRVIRITRRRWPRRRWHARSIEHRVIRSIETLATPGMTTLTVSSNLDEPPLKLDFSGRNTKERAAEFDTEMSRLRKLDYERRHPNPT